MLRLHPLEFFGSYFDHPTLAFREEFHLATGLEQTRDAGAWLQESSLDAVCVQGLGLGRGGRQGLGIRRRRMQGHAREQSRARHGKKNVFEGLSGVHRGLWLARIHVLLPRPTLARVDSGVASFSFVLVLISIS